MLTGRAYANFCGDKQATRVDKKGQRFNELELKSVKIDNWQ
jgi:hypothetical protein